MRIQRRNERHADWKMEGMMRSTSQTLKSTIIAMALSLGLAGTGVAADLYTLPTEEGLELFLLENHLQAPSLDVHSNARTGLTLGEDGFLTFTKPDSLARHFGVMGTAQTDQPAVGYQGFRTSPLGRVLSVEGRFHPNLGPATVETADSGQPAELRFDLGARQRERAGWEDGQGLRILSF
jgi:hypothetical protein